MQTTISHNITFYVTAFFFYREQELSPFAFIQRRVLEKYGTIKIDCAILFEFGRLGGGIAFYGLVRNPNKETWCRNCSFENSIIWIFFGTPEFIK